MADITPTEIKYGSQERTRVIDEHGSTTSRLTKYHAGVQAGPTSVRLKIRHPAAELTIEELGKMAHDLLNDPMKLNGTLELDRTTRDGKMYYYVVECYTVLEY